MASATIGSGVRCLVTPIKHLKITRPSHARHERFTLNCSYRRRPHALIPADPTSAPLGGLMIGDRAVGDPVTARREDAADVCSKGLLPQLIDVLHTLTEGQESLSRKIRDVRLEHTCHSAPVVERCPQAEPPNFAAPRPFVGTSPNGSIEIRREPPTDNVELRTGPASDNSFGNGSSPEPSIGVSAAPLSATVPEAESPSNPTASASNPPAVTVTHAGTPADLSSETSARTDWLNAARPVETTTAPLNRDYNFFDELDARLADLQDPADRSGEW
jgi:hypothetical protein